MLLPSPTHTDRVNAIANGCGTPFLGNLSWEYPGLDPTFPFVVNMSGNDLIRNACSKAQ